MAQVFTTIGLAVAVVIPLFVFIKLTATSSTLQGCLAMAGVIGWIVTMIITGIQLIFPG
ncbi:MAG: hypothetical protein BroJett011_70680 [Chloroflexota bacterium]|nr:MAG: hypothetical protein BroJett011_70680 [Chloroflexota bacterium]